MTPRLPDCHQIFPFRTGRQAGSIIQLSFFTIEFPCNFRCFLVNLLAAVAGLAEVFMPGQTVIAIPTVITPILHFSAFCDTFRADCNYTLVGGTGLQSSRFDGVGVEAELFLGDFIEVVFGIVL
jgi:hypothetical protein